MKLRWFASIMTGFAIAMGSVVTTIEPTVASSDKYYCAVKDGIPSTFSRTERGPLMLIKWKTQLSKEWTPLRRCVEVSKRFQRFHDHGLLGYIVTGRIDNQPVLCAVAKRADACSDRNILLTLPPETDAKQAARELLDTRALASGNIPVRGGEPEIKTDLIDGDDYYSLELIELIAPTVEGKLTPVESINSEQ